MAAISGSGKTRFGFVALIGVPNTGKSTLTNQMVGTKVSIVTHKVQTTRARLRAIVMSGRTQIVLVDTPGIFAPRRTLDRAMTNAAWESAKNSDIAVLILDATKPVEPFCSEVQEHVNHLPDPIVVAINKIDRLKKNELLRVAERARQFVNFKSLFMISALNGDGVADLTAYLGANLPEGPWLFPEDQIADAPQRQWAAECTREKILLHLHDELPYASTVETTGWKVLRNGSVRIEQTIYVERQSQKKIVLGKGGQTIKRISTEARKEISESLEVPVHLFIFVKVRGNWSEDPERYREMGLDYPTRS